jgi:NAD(P)-dependent dehydrogenase (short-subunit alcohol dehydrogenase family)
MMKAGGGSLVFVSTAAASIGLPNHEAIAAAKGGIEAMVRSAAATYGKSGVRVNAVSPGLVETPLTERITNSEAARSASEAMHALRRIGQPEDVAGAIAWLLSPEASWITGQTFGVDGGLGSVRSA